MSFLHCSTFFISLSVFVSDLLFIFPSFFPTLLIILNITGISVKAQDLITALSLFVVRLLIPLLFSLLVPLTSFNERFLGDLCYLHHSLHWVNPFMRRKNPVAYKNNIDFVFQREKKLLQMTWKARYATCQFQRSCYIADSTGDLIFHSTC